MLDLDTYQQLAQSFIGSNFNDPQLLQTAFTHCSYLNEHRRSVKEHNERLEFLGDAVLEIAVTHYLYLNYSQPEGILTNWRAALVRTESLARAAKKLDLMDYIRLSKGEKRSTARARQQILANTFEAVIGAIYLDQGYGAAEKFIADHIIITLDEILKAGSWLDAKTHFQEYAQTTANQTPVYRLLSQKGPDHDKLFFIGVFVNDELCGRGQGHSKQTAQQAAAQAALKAKGVKPPTNQNLAPPKK